jgi:sugar lactone lactonase YvrE
MRLGRWIGSAALLVGLAPALASDAVQLRPLAAPLYVADDGSGLLSPEGVGCSGDTLVVADTGNRRVVRYDMGGADILPVARYELPELAEPIRAVVDSTGAVLVLDGKLRRVGRIGVDGAFAGYLDPQGEGEPVLRSLAVGPDDAVYLLDVRGARVLVVDGSGAMRRSIALPHPHGSPSDVTVDASGIAYVLDSVGRRVFRALPADDAFTLFADGLDDVLVFPLGIAVDRGGRLYLADAHDGGIVMLGRDGTFHGRQSRMGWITGLLRYPSGVCVLDNGHLVVADRGNNRVQLFAIAE